MAMHRANTKERDAPPVLCCRTRCSNGLQLMDGVKGCNCMCTAGTGTQRTRRSSSETQAAYNKGCIGVITAAICCVRPEP
jgi:hypothetical protein